MGDCDFLSVFVDYETNSRPDMPEGERLRRTTLRLVAQEIPRYGFYVVDDPSDGWLGLSAKVHTSRSKGLFDIDVGLFHSIRLSSLAFVAAMSDPSIPIDDGLGWNWPVLAIDRVPSTFRIRNGLELITGYEKDELIPLCAASAAVKTEGWEDLSELRRQLVLEMKRLRRERRKATQAKQLELEVDRGEQP